MQLPVGFSTGISLFRRIHVLSRFLSQTTFSSYEEFKEKFRIVVPDHFNFSFDVVDEIAAKTPDKTALVWCDEKNNQATFSFAQMSRYSNKVANVLVSCGIGKGDPVMLVLKRRYEFWFTILALHKIGAIAIPATHLLSTQDIIYRNNAAEIKMIIAVADEHIISQIDAAVPHSPSLSHRFIVGSKMEGWRDFHDEVEKASDQFLRPTGTNTTNNDDSMLVYFTSGTTGMPKMVLHDFTYPLGHILTAKYWQNLDDNDLHLTLADTGWAKASWGKIYGQWIAGAAVFVYDYDRFNPKKLLRVIEHYGITSFCAPPTVYRVLIKEVLSCYDLSRLKHCVIAGEPLNPEIYTQFLKQTGLKLREGYGQTELPVTVGTYPWLEPKPGSMGKPSPGYHVDLLDEAGNPCGTGVEGQLVIRTDACKPIGMFVGYYRDHEKTRQVWHDNIYYTGDVAWRDEDGYYWFVGRVDDLIKSAGYRIGPFEVESALLEHPAVLECAVTGVPDSVRGQAVKATIVLANGYTASNSLAKELQAHVKKVTASYKFPRFIEFVEELPKTISGKILRKEIRAKHQS